MNQPRGIVILRCSSSLPTADGIFHNRELWRFDFISVQKFIFSETFNFCTKWCLNLTRKLTKIVSPKFKVWLILFRILWKVLLPKSKNRDKMSHRFQKLLKRHVSTFLEILYRTVVFLNGFVEGIFKIYKTPLKTRTS